jgi:serine protease Do
MNNKRLLFLTLVMVTLGIGVIIGTIVSGGVKATAQSPAALVIPDPVSLSNAFSQIAAQLEPAVVNINTQATVEAPTTRRGQTPENPFDFFDFFGIPEGPQRSRNLGTGFVVDSAGYIVTNHHVVEGADKIQVRLSDKSIFDAKLIGSDAETDLAVIKIEAGRDLAVAKFGNSDAAKTGDWVLAIGSPFDFDHTVTAGIISAVGREGNQYFATGPGQGQFQRFIQTDAAINPGNSGGPLLNMAGEVIGVNTAIVSETRQFSGLGFALPSNTAVDIYNQLVEKGKITRGGIGITYSAEPDELRALGVTDGAGVVVQGVTPGMPAARAGLRPFDVIREIDGKKITHSDVLLNTIASSEIGSTVSAKILRDGQEQTVSLVIGDRSEVIGGIAGNADPRDGDPGGESATTSLGVRVQGITPDMQQQLGLDSTNGVVVTAVDPGSPAEDANLVRGSVITGFFINGRRTNIRNMADFRMAERALQPGTTVGLALLVPNAGGDYSPRLATVRVP